MKSRLIGHRGIVRHVHDGKAVVTVETAGCTASGCGIGKMAGGRAATTLVLPAGDGLAPGDVVSVAVPENRLKLPAVLGYLFPAFAMLVGAAFGALLDGRDGATALGAIAGFLTALAIARVVIGLAPGLAPAPQLIPAEQPARYSFKEFDHDHSHC